MEPRVAIVLVNYNGAKFQNDCIRTIKESEYRNYKIIVVDNKSSDNSLELLRQEFNDVNIIELDENTGITGGNNAGIKYAINNGFDYVMLLNNDTEVDKNFLKEMVSFSEKNNCCVVPRIYFYDEPEKIWFAGCDMNWVRGNAPHYDYTSKGHDFNKVRQINCANTCCMLFPIEVVKQVGLMDDNYFIYYDDTDYCARVIKNGYKIFYIPDAKIWHKVSSSSGGDDSPLAIYYMVRNKLYFMKKNCSNPLVFLLFRFSVFIANISKSITKGEDYNRIRKIAIEHYKLCKFGKQQWD